MNEQTRAVIPNHFRQTAEVYIVAKISPRVVADLHLMPFLFKLFRKGFHIYFCIYGLVQIHVMLYLLIAALKPIVIGYGEIFIVVPTHFQMVNFIWADTHVQIEGSPLFWVAAV